MLKDIFFFSFAKKLTHDISHVFMLWFNFIHGLNFFVSNIVKHCHIQNQNKMKFKPRIKLNYNLN